MAVIQKTKPVLGCVFILLASVLTLHARTSLVSLPSRQDVAIRLEALKTTLVQEKRILTLKKGINKIDFSWQNVMIDTESITLQTLSHPDTIRILSLSYPPGESALVWDIYSPSDIEEEVIISYLLSNIDGIVTYNALADPEEQHLDLKTFLVLRNFSGENFDRAVLYLNNKNPFVTSIQNLETKRTLISQKADIPIQKIYVWDAATMPHDPEKSPIAVGIPTSYEVKTPFLQGKIRLFQQDSDESTLFLGEDMSQYSPEGGVSTLRIGDSRDIVVTQKRMDTKRTNIKRNTRNNIQVFDEIIKDQIVMENLKDNPVTLSLIETIPGQWKPVDISMAYTLKDFQTLVFKVKLLPKEKQTLTLHYTVLNIFAENFAQYNRLNN
jgi:hypothetical protein